MDGTKIFPLLSGNLSLDLVNTELVRRGQRQDLMMTQEDIIDWLYTIKENIPFWDEQLLQQVKERINQVFSSILEMRLFLRKEFESIADHEPISDDLVVYLEKKIQKAPFTYKLEKQKLIPIPVGEIEDVLLSLIAFNALTLIENNQLTFLKRCSNPECVLLFIDESGRRKWCSMKICGNRKKVSKFQQKHTEEH